MAEGGGRAGPAPAGNVRARPPGCGGGGAEGAEAVAPKPRRLVTGRASRSRRGRSAHLAGARGARLPLLWSLPRGLEVTSPAPSRKEDVGHSPVLSAPRGVKSPRGQPLGGRVPFFLLPRLQP